MTNNELLKPSEIGQEVYTSNTSGAEKRFSIAGKLGEKNGLVTSVSEVAEKTNPTDRFKRREMEDWNGGTLVYFRRTTE